MDRLREAFEDLGFAGVATHIASGNVIFDATAKEAGALERKIERGLKEALGFEVATFVRTPAELARIGENDPFPDVKKEGKPQVGFLQKTVTKAVREKVEALSNKDNRLTVHRKELYWLRFGGYDFGGPLLEKTLGQATTIRGLPTLQKIVAKHQG
jgi:uncharacterized protein (DUF1697 family)